MINELFVVLMMLSVDGVVHSANHATAQTHLNVYDTQQECEAELPNFVLTTYSEFDPKILFLDYQIFLTGAADSPEGIKSATWRCVSIFTY